MVHFSYGSRIKREPQRNKGGSDHSFSHDHVLSRFPYLSLSDISSLLMVFKSLGCPVKDRGLFLFFQNNKVYLRQHQCLPWRQDGGQHGEVVPRPSPSSLDTWTLCQQPCGLQLALCCHRDLSDDGRRPRNNTTPFYTS